MQHMITFAVAVLTVLTLTGCSGDSEFEDLRAFVKEVEDRPAGQIPPLPPFEPFEAFNYRASNMRSPFEAPVVMRKVKPEGRRSNVKPNQNRIKEYLEKFNVGQLRMVGTLSQSSTLFGLVQDPEGGVHRVQVGNFIGTDHGQIAALDDTAIELVEIVPDGAGGWVERARTVALGAPDRG